MASTYELSIKAIDRTSGPLKNIERALISIEKRSGRIKLDGVAGAKTAAGAGAVAGAIARIPGPLLAVTAAAGTAALGMTAIINATKEFEAVTNSLKLITNGTADLANTTQKLRDIAQATRTSFTATAELYSKLVVASDELGVSQDEVATVTANLSKALQVAGADGATTASVIRQFSQAMASGTVRGDEFNSLVEGLGPALSIMARETGINVGKLREMSQAGELTAKVMFDMLKNSNALNDSFAKMAPTLDSLETQLGDTFDRFLVNIGIATGATEAYKDTLTGFEGILNNLNKRLEQARDPLFQLGKQIIEQNKTVVELKAKIDELTTSQTVNNQAVNEANKELAAAEVKLSLLIAKYKKLKGEQSGTSESTKKVVNSFQKLMAASEKVAGEFKSIGTLTGIDKAQSDLLQLQNALDMEVSVKNSEVIMNKELLERIEKKDLHLETLSKINDKYSNTIAELRVRLKKLIVDV